MPEVAEEEAAADEASSVPSLPLVNYVALLLNAADRYFLDDEAIVGKVGRCLCGVNIEMVSGAASNVMVASATRQILCRIDQRVTALPFHVQNNFVRAACWDKVYSFAQLLVLTGQLQSNTGISSTAESLVHAFAAHKHIPMSAGRPLLGCRSEWHRCWNPGTWVPKIGPITQGPIIGTAYTRTLIGRPSLIYGRGFTIAIISINIRDMFMRSIHV